MIANHYNMLINVHGTIYRYCVYSMLSLATKYNYLLIPYLGHQSLYYLVTPSLAAVNTYRRFNQILFRIPLHKQLSSIKQSNKHSRFNWDWDHRKASCLPGTNPDLLSPGSMILGVEPEILSFLSQAHSF